MQSKNLRSTLLVAAAAAFGIPLAACTGEKPAKAPSLGTFEVPVSSASTSARPSGSAVEAGCGGGPGHSCGAMKDDKKPK